MFGDRSLESSEQTIVLANEGIGGQRRDLRNNAFRRSLRRILAATGSLELDEKLAWIMSSSDGIQRPTAEDCGWVRSSR